MSDESTKSPAAGTPGDGGALRPSGKRQVAGQATTAAATSRSKAPEVTAIFDFFRGVFSEIGKVIWPTGREMVNYTLIVLAFLIFMIALIAGVDWVATFLLHKILA